jgi:hypothetical protein
MDNIDEMSRYKIYALEAKSQILLLYICCSNDELREVIKHVEL